MPAATRPPSPRPAPPPSRKSGICRRRRRRSGTEARQHRSNADDRAADLRRARRSMAFAIKAEIRDPRAKTFEFTAQKTMYGGKRIAEGDTVFVFASENEGGQGLVVRG